MEDLQHATGSAPENTRSATVGQPGRTPAAPAEGRAIRGWSIATIAMVAAVGTAISSWHAYELIHSAGEPQLVAVGYPLLIDGVIFMASMNILQSARRARHGHQDRPVLAWLALVAGAAVTLAVNVAHGWHGGTLSQLVSAIPPLAVLISYELLMRQIRLGNIQPADSPTDVIVSQSQPPAADLAETSASPQPPALTLADAVLAASTAGISRRDLADRFEITRYKVDKILSQAGRDDGEAADDGPATDPSVLITEAIDSHAIHTARLAAVNGSQPAEATTG